MFRKDREIEGDSEDDFPTVERSERLWTRQLKDVRCFL